LLGVFAVTVTPREEEPQINVTMANLMIGFPGASVHDVEQMVTTPAEQVMARMEGVDHVMSATHPGLAIVTVQFKVGVSKSDALVRLHDTVRSHSDWLPAGLGVLEPVIKPKGIDDVPIVSITLLAKDETLGAYELERLAHSLEAELKRVPGTRDVRSIGGPGRAVMIEIDPSKMAGLGVSVQDIRQALISANQGLPIGDLLDANRRIQIEAGPWLSQAQDLEDLVLTVKDARAVFLHDVATVRDGPMPAQRYVWHGEGPAGRGKQYPAMTLSITKKPGENAIDVAQKVIERVDSLQGSLIPQGISYLTTRN
jgi:multidrug efflux pump subunit AcrB